MFNIYKNSYTIDDLIKKHNIRNIYNHLKNGFEYNSKIYKGKEEVLKLLQIDVSLDNFRIDFRRAHIELFGNKEELENFKEKFKINHKVLLDKEKNEWHLAFDGLLYEYLNARC